MNFCDFKLLHREAQAHILCKEGIFLGERMQDDCIIALYSVDNFYVEVYYRFEDNEIIKIISFHSDYLLTPYLDSVEIDDLLNDRSYTNDATHTTQ